MSNARLRRDSSRSIASSRLRPLRNRSTRAPPESMQAAPAIKQGESQLSKKCAVDEESQREVATILARVKGKTAEQTKRSNLEDEAPSVAVPVGASDRARELYRSQRPPPPSSDQDAAPQSPEQQPSMQRQDDVSQQRAASFAVDVIDEAEEEETLRAHETLLREQMEAVAQRQAQLKYKRLEASLREATAHELRTQQDHLARELQDKLLENKSTRTEKEKKFHELKGQLSAQIEELCTLYETVLVQEREFCTKRDTEESELRSSVNERMALMEAAAEEALQIRLAEEVARQGWRLPVPPLDPRS